MKVLVSIAALLASATALAATVHADPNDAQFLQTIRNGMGREVTDGQGMIDSAHELCTELQQGKSYDDVVVEVRQANDHWDAGEAAFFVSASARPTARNLSPNESAASGAGRSARHEGELTRIKQARRRAARASCFHPDGPTR